MASSASEIEAAMKAKLAESQDVREQLHELAEKAADYARSIAPVGEVRDPHPGAFRDSIEAREGNTKKGLPTAKIVSTNPAASFIEYGTARTPEHGTFIKTAAHFNGKGDAGLGRSKRTGRQRKRRSK
jgi:hypothetical protein